MDDNAWKRVYAAVKFGKQELYDDFIETADINEPPPEWNSLLHMAAAKGRVEMAADLLERGAEVNLRAREEQTPLHYAVQRGQSEVVELLLDSGADVSAVDEYGNEPLWYAVADPDPPEEIVYLLLESGADPTHRNYVGESPLSIARDRGFDELGSRLARHD